MRQQSSSTFEGSEPRSPMVGAGGPAGRPTYAQIDLDAVAHNLRCVRRQVGETTRVYAVVKADAYGHGLVQVAQRLQHERVDGVCVALAEEGFRLRAAQISVPILVLSGAYGSSHREVLQAGLTPVIHNIHQALAFSRARPSEVVNVHLQVDTGMCRLGVTYDELPGFLDQLRGCSNLRLQGLFTHLASADTDQEFTRLQCRRFAHVALVVRSAGYAPEVFHVANSAGIYAGIPGRYDLVRPGLALFGIAPMPGVGAELRPAMRVVSEVLALRSIGPQTPVGYGGSYRSPAAAHIATVPIGYGDGFLRAASNRGTMLVRGVHCPIVGRVSMDLTMLDVTQVGDVQIGDEVVVLGRQGAAELSAGDLATAAGTIPYEVLCNLSTRVPRIYGAW